MVTQTSSPALSTSGEKDLATRFRLAHAANLCRGGHGQAVEAAQRVGVHGLVEAALGVQHARGALSGGGAVKEGQLGVAGQQGEVLLEGVLVNLGRGLGV